MASHKEIDEAIIEFLKTENQPVCKKFMARQKLKKFFIKHCLSDKYKDIEEIDVLRKYKGQKLPLYKLGEIFSASLYNMGYEDKSGVNVIKFLRDSGNLGDERLIPINEDFLRKYNLDNEHLKEEQKNKLLDELEASKVGGTIKVKFDFFYNELRKFYKFLERRKRFLS